MSLTRGAVGWSVVRECDIIWSYSLGLCYVNENALFEIPRSPNSLKSPKEGSIWLPILSETIFLELLNAVETILYLFV